MAIFTPLAIGRSALLAHQRALTTTGQNIANAETPGYRRQTTEFASRDGDQGFGVRVVAVEHAVDRFVEAQLLRQGSRSAGAEVRKDVLDRVQELFPIDEPSVGGALDAFWAAAQRVADRPEDLAVRGEFLARAEELTARVRSLSEGLATRQRELDDRVRGDVEDANVVLRRIARLNQDIVRAETGGERANELRDQRDAALLELSEFAAIRATERENGAVDVELDSSGLALVIGEDVQEFAIDVGAAGLDGTPLSEVGVRLSAGPIVALPSNPGGRIGALEQLRDVDLPARSAELDTFALALRDAVNAVQTDPAARDLNGAVGLDLFTATSAADLRVVLSDPRGVAAGLGTNPADNQNALRLLDVREDSLAGLGGSTLSDYFGALQASVGNAARTAADESTVESSAMTSLQGRRDAVSAVSLEEEFTDLIRFQRGFQAAAQLINVSDRMLDELIGLVR